MWYILSAHMALLLVLFFICLLKYYIYRIVDKVKGAIMDDDDKTYSGLITED